MSKKEVKEETSGDKVPAFKVNDKRVAAEDEGIDEGSEAVEEKEEQLPTYLLEMKQRAEQSEQKLKEYIAAYKEKLAENDAFRQRLENDFKARGEKIKGEVISSFLTFADNLDRAVDAVPDDESNPITNGIKIVRDMFWDCMVSHGVEHIKIEGECFDPNISEALVVEAVSDKEKDNLVIAELEKGYRIEDRLLRIAKVKVAVFKEGE